MNPTCFLKTLAKNVQFSFSQYLEKERNETMNSVHSTCSYKSVCEKFVNTMKMSTLLIALIFPTLLFLSLGYMGRDALKSRIAEKANITVFFKPGVAPKDSSLESLNTGSPWGAIKSLELIPPTTAVNLLIQQTSINTSMFTKNIPPEAFTSALVVGLDSEHLEEVSDVVTSLNTHLKDIQEIRYPAAAIKEAQRDLQRIDSFLPVLTIISVLITIGGCLVVLSTAAKNKWFSGESISALSCFAAASLSALLLFITGELIGNIANWHFSLPAELYECIILIAAAVSVLVDIFYDEKTKFLKTATHNEDEVDETAEVPVG